MKTDNTTQHSGLRRWLGALVRLRPAPSADATQIEILPHAELFSVEQMEKHGQTLAAVHVPSVRPAPDRLLDRLDDNAAILVGACRTLDAESATGNRVMPAGEWLLDNFYLIEEQIRTSKRHLPKSYGRGLPKLISGYSRGYPRVYDIALHVIAHGDGRWDLENLSRFIIVYQDSASLMLGELWAIPIMLRLALIENLARIGERVASGHKHRDLAAGWASRMEIVAESDPKSLILVIADMARSNPPLSSAFVAELARRLQGRGAALALPLTWIEQRLAENGLTIEQQVHIENQQQAAHQTTVSNSIASLRRLAETDWREFVEQMSAVHRTLLTDPSGTYGAMDFPSRDQYRHAVEKLAHASKLSENDIALAAIHMAAAHPTQSPQEERQAHVGYYLIGNGLRRLERAVVARYSLSQRIRMLARMRPVRSYIGLISLLTLGTSGYLLALAYHDGLPVTYSIDADFLLLMTLAATLLLTTSQLALALVNRAAALLVSPRRLPRMDYSKGIPAEYRTLVVVPAMLGNEMQLETLIEALEIRFLGNRDAAVHFALLTDFNDAATQNCPEDSALLAQAQMHIEALNQRYPAETGDSFFLFHRPRQWNPGEKKWMGYERKRGKLSDLNAFLLGDAVAASHFNLIVGRTDILNGAARVKYVITLDSDTQLPRDSARQFVATMTHPLNRPRYDRNKQCVTEGHAILQPRIAEALSSPGPSRYARLLGSEPGIDPYTRTVSDVYQDLFDEGSFIGKGIYDVAVFEQVLEQRFPENTILSHDLIEGCYLRAGLISDVPLYEQSPGSYLADVRRRTRWIRGDWQLAGWLLPRVLNRRGKQVANPLGALSHWKLLDNLRRSLVPVALLLLPGLGASMLASPVLWLGVTAFILILSPLVATAIDLADKPPDVSLRQHLQSSLYSLRIRCGQLLFQVATLPHEAAYGLGAIMQTVWRMRISHRRLLEWMPSDQAGRNARNTPLAWLRSMVAGPLVAIVTTALLALYRPHVLPLAMPLLLLWLISPIIAAWLSRPFTRKEAALDVAQMRFLHMTARKTWEYFAHFVSAADDSDNALPPDNYQEEPREAVAHRTSPTNMGLALLANLSAFDFGYLSMGQLLARTQDTLRTMAGLERYRGHFYNWYDTQTLQPLAPRYVSTVDSGNLAGNLLVLRQGLLELIHAPLLNPTCVQGLTDTLDVLGEHLKVQPAALLKFRALLVDAPTADASLAVAEAYLRRLCIAAEDVVAGWPVPDSGTAHRHEWAQKLLHQCQSLHQEVCLFSAVVVPQGNASLHAIANSAAMADGIDSPAIDRAMARITLIESLAAQAYALAQQDYDFLYDPVSHLMTVGFQVDAQRSDRGNYDLLSSEARLGIYVAIAQGKIPQESWFALGRLLVLIDGEPVLVSWTGSMFEYLMPLLIMPGYDHTLLDQTCRAAVHRQIDYGKQHGVAWGISESGFNAVDVQLNYQYRAFGVPGLGLKRGLAGDLVIAPYASVMALMVEPKAACDNLQRLAAEHASGRFGFYEAIDHTPARLPPGKSSLLIRSFMTHHQGMSLLALSSFLHQCPMQRRFVADTQLQATLLLLQERIPKPVASYSQAAQASLTAVERSDMESTSRVFDNPNTPAAEVQLLSNGRYHLMLTQAGGGYSRWRDLAVTRWRADGTCDDLGLFGYLRDVNSGAFWSGSYQPTTGATKNYKAIFSEAHAEFRRREHDIETHIEVSVSPEDDIELRRIRIFNRSKTQHIVEYTSYGEVVLAPQAADLAHPAFSNLFVETEILHPQHAILATRRPRSAHETPPWLCHMLTVHSDAPCQYSCETDRARFIGRGRTLADPAALHEPGPLSNTAGAVLDPIISIRCRITLEAGASVTLDQITGVSESRAQCIELVERYRDRRISNRVFALAWTHNQVLLRQLNASEADARLYSQLAGAIIYSNPNRRAPPLVLASNQRGQSGLWGYAISGDLPIVLLHIGDIANIELVRQLLQAHAYWRQKGLAVDLVILNEEGSNYRQSLQDQIIGLMAAGTAINTTDRSGGIFVRATEHMPAEDRTLLRSVAHIILSDRHGTLAEQVAYRPVSRSMPANLVTDGTSATTPIPATGPYRRPDELLFFNGLGGFKPSGEEYVITLDPGQHTPAPWVNVIANPTFGTVVSESGQSYTWTENAHEMRLTPWENDPVRDTSGELYYLRDEESGRVWSPTALPHRGNGTYTVRHGFGYSIFEHDEDGIHSELCIHVALDAAVKFASLRIRNDTSRARRLSATGYVEWVLGDLRSRTDMHVVTETDSHTAILARNRYSSEFGKRTAFFHAVTSTLEPVTRSLTGDRAEFLGRNGSHQSPTALQRTRLSGRVGAGLDPCAAIQIGFNLVQGQTREIVFMLGAGRDRADADAIISRFPGKVAVQEALAATRQYWQHTLGAVQVHTPDPAVDLLTNGWLLYQTLSSRLWARSGYYQSGGAFGFRDQLQDAMAFVHTEPQRLREQIVLCASRQFAEGDVQHWWHPPQGRGVRTRCSDDYLWLPYALCRYIGATGDHGVLDELTPFLQGRLPNAGEESVYDLPLLGNEKIDIYTHAVQAIRNGLRFGSHGLPLIGSGDWNDGMNLVGEQGRGESIWLGFFLYAVLQQFSTLARHRNDGAVADLCQTESLKLRTQIEAHGWDGEWYRRAYFDDGTPLGSSDNAECRIDAIAQSWAVLSGAGEAAHSRQAMEALHAHLVDTKDRLIRLFTPPFDKGTHNPGYIKGYVPGVRENGGQYTHAAVWAAMAYAELGDHVRAWQLFDIINPIKHGRTRTEIATYRIEPYVMAADVYGVAPHIGRGGWSWYTGSAGWTYRLIVESLLGLKLESTEQRQQLCINPCLPDNWKGYTLDYRYGETLYRISVQRTTDGDVVSADVSSPIVLIDDGQVHSVNLRLR
ncbi:MAG TPA: glucoamylase family protein [Rhodocyclaceae bacterium]|nr:glucoamylase family protein [Rhodocyclaceae bacterium]